jgi:cytochrome c
MKCKLFVVAGVLFGITVLASSATAGSTEMPEVAKKHNCNACHTVERSEKPMPGPAWKDVAVKYQKDPAAKVKIIGQISKGGSGNGKHGNMPAFSNLDKDELDTIVTFIMGLK